MFREALSLLIPRTFLPHFCLEISYTKNLLSKDTVIQPNEKFQDPSIIVDTVRSEAVGEALLSVRGLSLLLANNRPK